MARSNLGMWVFSVVLVGVAALPAAAAGRADRLDRLEREIADLRSRLQEIKEQRRQDERLAELELRVEVLAEELENLRVGDAARADFGERGMGPAASKVYRASGVSVGGYGEALYTAYDDRRDDGSPSGKTATFDLLRHVLYVGYHFDDRFVFNSEVEIEHANTEEHGAVELEFAYVDWMLRPEVNLRAGMVLVPVGFLNEVHEPTTFLGATRPELTRRILPTTWSENGFGVYGEAGGFSYRSYVLTGLDATGFSAAGIRGGRQHGSKARAEDLAWVGRVDFTGMPGLTLGGSVYTGGADQGRTGLGISLTLAELHGEWRWRGWKLRAVGARVSLNGVERLNENLGLRGGDGIAEGMSGWYVEAGYDLLAGRETHGSLAPYLRWEQLNTQDDPAAGYGADPANDLEIVTLGVAFKPMEQIVLKADWQNWKDGAGTGVDRFNLALGYIF